MDPISLARLAITTSESVSRIARLLKGRQTNTELKIFYVHLQVHCVLVSDCIRLMSSLDNWLTIRILKIFDLLIADQRSAYPGLTSPYARLHVFNRAWSDLQSRSPETRLEFAARCLNADVASRNHEYNALFSDWEEQLDMSRAGMVVSYLLPPKECAEPPSAVRDKAHCLFEALRNSSQCACMPAHELGARLCLSTYRKLSLDGDCDFNLFITSDKDLREAHVRTVAVGESVASVAPSDEMRTTLTSKLDDKLQIRDGKKPPGGTMVVTKMCKQLEKMRRKFGDEMRLELKVEEGKLIKYRSASNEIEVHRKRPPVSLQQVIRKGARLLTEEARRTLAVQLSYAVFHLHGTPWLPPTWDASQIMFFFTPASRLPLRPFIQAQLGEHADSDGLDPDDLDFDDLGADDSELEDLDLDDVKHPFPTLITLAKTLMEVYFATPFGILAKNRGIELSNTTNSTIWSLDVSSVFNAYEREFPLNSSLYCAIEKCLDPWAWRDEEGCKVDDKTMRAAVYRGIVLPLVDESSIASDFIGREEPDKFDGAMDICYWGRGQPSILAPEYDAAGFYDDEELFDAHSSTKLGRYLDWKDEYERVYYENIREPPRTPVKIAILDTGIDVGHPAFANVNIKLRRNWISETKEDTHDGDGHGTFTTGLVADYAPDSELYIARIAEKSPCPPTVIAEAITKAVNDWKVDMISMSFGYPTNQIDGYDKLEAAILDAHSKHVLMFAAASNSGVNRDRAYPARDQHVICVHSTDSDGNRSGFSPSALSNKTNIATVGEVVQSAWPKYLCDARENPDYVQVKSGTSFATPIAVGIAAFLLQYARIYLPKEEADRMKHQSKMEEVFLKVSEKTHRSTRQDDYNYVALSCHPDNLFGKRRELIVEILGDILRR